MEQHHVVDFCSRPQDRELWVALEEVPTDAWTDRLDRALDDDVRRVRPAVADGERLSLLVDASVRPGLVDEYEALTLLEAYVHQANRAEELGADAPSDGARVRPATD